MANTKLLLVEDDENLAYMEKSCFEDIIGGYEVKTAVNGKEGLKVWQDFQPDVIVSDIDMPIMDGIEMVKKIREVDGKTIILFTTGLTSPKDLKAGYAAGANNYVKKPFIPEELDAHIHSLLQLKAGARSENASNQIKLGKYILDADHATLKDTQDGKQKMLTAREAKILELLAVNKNEVVRREAVLSRFWGVEDEAQHLLALINRLLTISKLEHGKLHIQKAEVNLETMIEDVVDKYKAKSAKPIHITTHIGATTALADEEYLKEAISNLVDNATKYSKEEINIQISTLENDKNVYIKVFDEGIGIAKSELKTIFNRFERAAEHEKDARKTRGGFGIGLNYVLQVINTHGGRISVKSEKGKWSEFTISLPK